MPKLIDLVGRKFAQLLVISRAIDNKGKKTRWSCLCDCGRTIDVWSQGLLLGTAKNCGSTETHISNRGGAQYKKHGLVGTQKYKMYMGAKERAKQKGIPFTLTLLQMPDIPEYCPALGLKLEKNLSHGLHDTSPSLDRIIPSIGYVSGNVQIISGRANKMKANATTEEIGKLYNYMLEVERQHEKEIVS